VVYANHEEDDKGNEVYELAVESQGYEESGSGGVVRIMESERKSSVEAMQGGDQLAFLWDLVETLLRQMQDSREEQKVMIAKIDVQNKKIDTQNGTIEALRALSEDNVTKPTYSQVAQTGTIPPNEAQR
jgi:hypothetical protein